MESHLTATESVSLAI